MNVKKYLQHKFRYEEQQGLDREHISDIQSRLLTQLKKQKKHPLLQYKYLFISVGLAIAVFAIGARIFSHNITDKGRVVQIVSAQEVIKRTQLALKESDRVYYKIHYSGKHYEKEVKNGVNVIAPEKGTFEFWYDFASGNFRIEQPDYYGDNAGKVKRALIQKKITNNKYLLYQFTADPKTKEGMFGEEYISHDLQTFGYSKQLERGINLPINPKKRFEDILGQFQKEKKAKLETFKEKGKEYYKLILTLPYDTTKEGLVITGYELFIDKNTYTPYKEIQQYENGKGIIETIYDEVSTDFGEDIFGPIPPKGYSILQNPKLKLSEDEPRLIRCGSNALNENLYNYNEVCPNDIYGVYTILSAEFSNGKSTIRFGHQSPSDPEIKMGVDFKLYRSEQTFRSQEEANKAKDVKYLELKKTQTGVFQEPEIPTPHAFKKFRIDVFDSKTGKKIDEVYTTHELIVIEELG